MGWSVVVIDEETCHIRFLGFESTFLTVVEVSVYSSIIFSQFVNKIIVSTPFSGGNKSTFIILDISVNDLATLQQPHLRTPL